MATTMNGHQAQTLPQLDTETPPGTLRYVLARMEALERRVRDLEEWLDEVASDLLDSVQVA